MNTMTAKRLLDKMERKGIRVSIDGERLTYKTTREPLTPELLEELKVHKQGIIDALKGDGFPKASSGGHFQALTDAFRGTQRSTASMSDEELFRSKGWVEIRSNLIGQNFYLVKDETRLRFLPDKKLPVLFPKDVEDLKGMSKDEREQAINFRFNLAPTIGREVPSTDFEKMDRVRIHGLEHAIKCNPKELEWYERCKAALQGDPHNISELDARVRAVQLSREKRWFRSLLRIDNRYARRVVGFERSTHLCEDSRLCPHGLDFQVPGWVVEDLRRWNYFGHLVDDEIQELIAGLNEADREAIDGWQEAGFKDGLPEDVARITAIKLLAKTVEEGERKTKLELPKLYTGRVGSEWLREIVPQYETIN